MASLHEDSADDCHDLADEDLEEKRKSKRQKFDILASRAGDDHFLSLAKRHDKMTLREGDKIALTDGYMHPNIWDAEVVVKAAMSQLGQTQAHHSRTSHNDLSMLGVVSSASLHAQNHFIRRLFETLSCDSVVDWHSWGCEGASGWLKTKPHEAWDPSADPPDNMLYFCSF